MLEVFYKYAIKFQRAKLHNKEIRIISIPLYKEFRRWHSSFDKGLIRSLNKPTFKYYTYSGIKHRMLKKIYGFIFKKSDAYQYINDSESALNKVIKLKQERIKEAVGNININNQGQGDTFMAENKYAGTKTEKNLWEAFAGESQARSKYTYFA